MEIKKFLKIADEFNNIIIQESYPFTGMLTKTVCSVSSCKHVPKEFYNRNIRCVEITDCFKAHSVTITIYEGE